jgi:hypothetical protein
MLAGLKNTRPWLVSGIFMLMGVLSGCATQSYSVLDKWPADLPPKVEHTQTPFFPQDDYQCGPAALATSLVNNGISVTPEQLVSQVYVPKRKGSLQVEMLATARRSGAFTMPIPPTLDALLTEVAAGNNVIVLQNLSLPVSPIWHYAVVIGYDLTRAEIILRSGTTRRLTMPMTTFEHTWKRSNFWGMVTVPPGKLPKTATAESTVDALLAFEQSNKGKPVYDSYVAGLVRWPTNLTLLMGSGNAAYATKQFKSALIYFESAVQHHPRYVPALNNLALTQAQLGQFAEARDNVGKALAIGGPWSKTVLETFETIRTMEKQKN